VDRGSDDSEESADGSPDADGTAEDASPELDTSWPTPVPTEPDPDMTAAREVIDIEAHEADLLACQVCLQCQQGNLAQCLDPLVPVVPGRAVDELARWRERASRNVQVGSPRVSFASGGPENGRWYEVVGYDVEASAPTIVLRPDWRSPGAEFVPGQHLGVEPGRVLEVAVGPMATDHRGDVRIFYRADGGGRFVLREAHYKKDQQEKNQQLAISLSRASSGLLAGLTEGQRLLGHAIPRREPDCMTLTFLGLLRGHWDQAANRYERLDVTRRDGTQGRANFYRGIVVGEPNDAGWATIASALRDPERGIEHLFGVRATHPGQAPASLRARSPVLIQVRPEIARLEVGGLPAAALLDLIEAYPDSFHPLGPPPDRVSGSDDQPADITRSDTVPGGWCLPAKSPVSARAARRLANLNPASREWASLCWYFWARSRHLQTATADGYRPGTDTSPVVIPADATVLPADSGADGGNGISPVTVCCLAPAHWANLVRFQADAITTLFGATSVTIDGRQVVAGFADEASARAAQPLVARVLQSPAAQVEYPAQGDRIARERREYALQPMAERGMYVANLDWKNSRLTVVGDASVFAGNVTEIARRLSLTTGWLRVPEPRNNGLLIGPGGETVKRLRAQSGCTSAQSEGRGTVGWNLVGPTPENIQEFIRLAQGLVPGVTGGITETVAATVTDLTSGHPVTDPRTHPWPGFTAQAPQVEGIRPPDADSAVASPGGAPSAGSPSSAPPSPTQPVSSSRQPAPSGDDLLRRAVASFRAGGPVAIDIAEVTDLPAECVLSFLAGLASSLPGSRLADDGATRMRLTPAAGPALAKPTPTGDVRRYALSRVGHAHQAPTTMLLMGDCVILDMSGLPTADEVQLTYYFLGLSRGLGVSFRAPDAKTLVIG
jgi:hypothetical protein